VESPVEHRLRRSLRTTFLGIAINIVLAAGKMTAGFLGNSQALVADGVESLADIFSSLIVWRGLVVAAAPPDAEHPYGHGKAEPIASAVVGAMLAIAAVWIGAQSIREILTPHHTPAPYTLIVLIGVVIVKETLFRRVLQTGAEVDSSAVKSDAWHHRSDAITSIAAGIGIGVALLGGKGWESADDIAALFAAGIIAWNGWRIVRPALSELMDASAPRELVEQIKTIAAGVPGADYLEKCVVRRHGYFYFVDLHVQVRPQMSVEESHRIAHTVKSKLQSEIPRIHDVLVHIEPSQAAQYP
jgi:cation diffusion facilitator family transporter